MGARFLLHCGALWALVAGLGCAKPPSSRVVIVELPLDVPPDALSIEPPSAVLDRRNSGRSVILTVEGEGPLRASAPGACPRDVGKEPLIGLDAVISLPQDIPQIGWDQTHVVTVVPQCEDARRGHVTWRDVEGSLASFAPADEGFSVRIRIEPFAASGASVPWGIVPLSPRTRGAHRLEATWVGPRGERVVREVRVSAMARASGVPSVAKGQEVLLGGAGWHVMRANPKEARPVLEKLDARTDLFRFRADVAGQFLLVDGAGVPLSIRTNTHEHVPLDCGRGECHASVAADVQTSAMTHVLRNGLEGVLGANYDASCAVMCHAVGEPGLSDDGFVEMQRALGVPLAAATAAPVHAGAWDELPRALRRLGGVGCTSCHGPAAIPEATARFSILRADVCATCHDAPPRYSHVVRWRTSAMAHADRDPEAASDPLCQRCHTTAGFLRTLSSAPRETTPSRAGLVGIACVACHAPHGAHGARLVREVPVPPAFVSLDTASRICVACHERDAARVWLGDATSPSAHAALGCAACHLDGSRGAAPHAVSPDGSRGLSHDFHAGASCRTCHASGVPSDGGLTARATIALEALTRKGTITWADARSTDPTRPPHARRAQARSHGDAVLAQSLLSVVEDRAAFVHNARFTRAVVERAERAAHE